MSAITSAWRRTWVRNSVWSFTILLLVASAMALGGLRPLDDLIDGLRFRAVTREASQSLTIVEIDARSLEAAGSWPWERRRYATAIDNLVEAGATLVAFDIDFSATSDAASDKALADAISRHPGQVTLGTFIQNESLASSDGRIVSNRPIPALMRDALVASVNVPVDSDGSVRRYDFGSRSQANVSVAAMMAGAARKDGDFVIDFGIDRGSITHLSFDDVLNNRFDAKKVEGRVILIGATALELGDEFATPVGLIPGVVIHGLAYESLVGGRALMSPHGWLELTLCLLLGLLLLPRRDGDHGLRVLILRHVLGAASILGLPILIQDLFPISLQVGPLLATQVLYGVWATRVELARRATAIIMEREAGLLHLALHQPETELPNRRALLKRIADARAEAPGRSISIVTIGVERHAEMRGVVGYNVANHLISKLAERLAALARVEQVAHISSSVLAFAKPDIEEQALRDLLADLLALETNFQVDGHSIDIYLRLGAAVSTDDQLSPELLVEQATVALNKARGSLNRVEVHDSDTFASPANNLALMTEMLEALSSGDIALHYQPKMTTSDGKVASVEALCRWRHPVRGYLSPDLFIPIAEETGQIRALTEWSFLRIIKDQERLRAAGHDLTVALNVSGRLLADEAFRDQVLEFAGSIDCKLCLEITETAVIDNPRLATEAIAAFQAAGLKISIDDYGSGLSSLGYLKMLNADELKVDKSLVVEVAQNQRDRLLMKSTIDLAHSLGMSVVAEGVEDNALAACLSLMGCDMIQGYWVSKPLPVAELVDFMDQRTSGSAVSRMMASA